jgi:hypothetical protein
MTMMRDIINHVDTVAMKIPDHRRQSDIHEERAAKDLPIFLVTVVVMTTHTVKPETNVNETTGAMTPTATAMPIRVATARDTGKGKSCSMLVTTSVRAEVLRAKPRMVRDMSNPHPIPGLLATILPKAYLSPHQRWIH